MIAGAVLAVFSFLAVFVVGGALSGSRLSGNTTKIVVAAQDIPLRSVIGADQLTTVTFAQADVPPGAFTAVGGLLHMTAELNIAKGQPITDNMVAKSPDQIAGPSPAYLPIPSGFVAMTIPTGEQQGVAGYIQAGDYITVQATANTNLFGANPGKSVTKTVFTNTHVIRVGPQTGGTVGTGTSGSSGSQAQGGLSSSLTVVMTECDAEYLNWLAQNTTLKYVLESYKDYAPAATGPDASCPRITAAHGAGPGDVNSRFGFTAVS